MLLQCDPFFFILRLTLGSHMDPLRKFARHKRPSQHPLCPKIKTTTNSNKVLPFLVLVIVRKRAIIFGWKKGGRSHIWTYLTRKACYISLLTVIVTIADLVIVVFITIIIIINNVIITIIVIITVAIYAITWNFESFVAFVWGKFDS